MSDGTGLAEALLGLDGVRVLEVSETPDELVGDLGGVGRGLHGLLGVWNSGSGS